MDHKEENLRVKQLKNQVVCPVEFALRILGGKWRGSILYQLKDGPLRFNELKHNVQCAAIDYEGADNYLTNKVLSGHVKELTDFGLVEKDINSEENAVYRLSPSGIAMIPILLELFDWGEHLMRLPNGNHFLENDVIALPK
ncbi:MAG: helix-turn-helix domain-containing protein [Crocinitomicaceae bacterium]|nr:helix-turn-helix domain-containing protein [Crocinitomicaceae bacterium]